MIIPQLHQNSKKREIAGDISTLNVNTSPRPHFMEILPCSTIFRCAILFMFTEDFATIVVFTGGMLKASFNQVHCFTNVVSDATDKAIITIFERFLDPVKWCALAKAV